MTQDVICQPVVVNAAQSQWMEFGDHRGMIAMSSHDTGGAFSLFVLDVQPNGGPPPHIHTREDETFYIQSGRFAIRVNDEIIEVEAGDTVFGPRGVPHGFRCISEEGGKLLVWVTPGENFQTFARTMAENGALAPDDDSIAKLIALAETHGIQMLPPQ